LSSLIYFIYLFEASYDINYSLDLYLTMILEFLYIKSLFAFLSRQYFQIFHAPT